MSGPRSASRAAAGPTPSRPTARPARGPAPAPASPPRPSTSWPCGLPVAPPRLLGGQIPRRRATDTRGQPRTTNGAEVPLMAWILGIVSDRAGPFRTTTEGRVPYSQSGGRGFEPPAVHQTPELLTDTSPACVSPRGKPGVSPRRLYSLGRRLLWFQSPRRL